MDELPRLLVTDLETTGVDDRLCGIVEIGAKWLTGGSGEFGLRCRPFDGAVIEPKAIEINGCDWLNDWSLDADGEAVRKFLTWVGRGPVILCAQNPKLDYGFLLAACRRYGRHGLEMPFVHRTMDLHTLAVSWAIRNGRRVPDKGIYTDEIYAMLHMEPEPKPHRALVGARKEHEAFATMLPLGVPGPLRPVPYAFCDPLQVREIRVGMDELPEVQL